MSSADLGVSLSLTLPQNQSAPEFVASDACFCRSCRRRVGRRQGKGGQLSADELSGAHSTAAKENALIANACRMAMLPSHRAEGLKLLVRCPYLDDDEKRTEFQDDKYQVFVSMKDKFVGKDGIVFVERSA